MRQRLEELALDVEREILTTGTIMLDGRRCYRNSISDNPYAGLCGYAVQKLRVLAPDLRVRTVSFTIVDPQLRVNHVVADIEAPEGRYVVDPTIHQFNPTFALVYGPQDSYPLRIAAGTVNKISRVVIPQTI